MPPPVAATSAVAVNRPTPGIVSSVAQAGDCRATSVSCCSSPPMRASSARISSSSCAIVPRSTSGIAGSGSASSRAICPTPARAARHDRDPELPAEAAQRVDPR